MRQGRTATVRAQTEPAPLRFKPDMAEVSRRWEAYWAGELLDRPIVCAAVREPGYDFLPESTYYERVHGDLDAVLDRALHNAAGTFYGAETVPQFWLSFGPDEIAAFCGATLEWSQTDADTNWSVPFVKDWDESLPLRLQEDNPLWLRMQTFYRRAAERLTGKMLLMPLDFHTNMDLLAAVRDPQRLCTDLYDCPAQIDRAMLDARRIFREVWDAIRSAGRMDEFGYAFEGYSAEGVSVLACDFSALISPAMFRRWVRPALEEEAALVKHAIYHWDGPRALAHFDDVMAIKGFHTISFVPDPGESHVQYLDLFKQVQAHGKAVQVWGEVDEIKFMHAELDPARVQYRPKVRTRAELDEFLAWLVRHT